ncbi:MULTISPECIES: class I SAM-dependent methyltransferase [unclassified Ruegeria]|uniref:class I SAM-dependent methyltransferase n=1 Tax=unclassified Ruegeria TaxID=2625375 RepID=UPI00148984B8|nr:MULTISPECIES: methyltransferase domain-containing protein [unclassified Ruegeria]NOD74585.1 methyltransferase domain-containing protein [Ruegeria sp. HKCCD4332]NOD88682.1 methyltransferase domain-containing protein [Ruegeria sp. HKCCD4318]NOE12090.1 methyltransferase domain-containing protein [Ruegeria sp. HKCCD4318-2]NOG09746.1 methyltransferase domain-containing protein [Ruegeria sp. HKCCD4315]
MDIKAVQTSYARWAPVYDRTFGAVTNVGRQHAVEYINRRPGKVLEVGVGTGLSLEHYGAETLVTGIDFSEDMLEKARDKVQAMSLKHVKALVQMDARTIEFPDNHFDTVAAMHVLSVVPEPETVMAEIARVCKPGGRVVITNHFQRKRGLLASMERIFAPLANTIGWHSDFEIETVLQEDMLAVEEQRPLPPLGMMTFLVLRKSEAA